MITSYSTMPADLESEATLLNKPKAKTSFKTLVGGAAIAAFVLGALAASAVSTPSAAVRAPAMHFKSAAPSVQAPVLDGKSDEIYQQRAATPAPSTQACTMPEWMNPWTNIPRGIREGFQDVISDYLPHHMKKSLELVDLDGEEYCEAFESIGPHGICDAVDGLRCVSDKNLFGDFYPDVGGGGIDNFAVFKVKEGAKVELYGARDTKSWGSSGFSYDDKSDLYNTWFADETAFTHPRISFSTYSNDRMAIAFPKDHFTKCTMKPGALIVIGSGGWRNTTTAYYQGKWDGTPLSNTIINEVQTPDPKYLQYITHVQTAAEDCKIWDLDVDDMWASMDKKGIQWMKHGERVGKDPLVPPREW